MLQARMLQNPANLSLFVLDNTDKNQTIILLTEYFDMKRIHQAAARHSLFYFLLSYNNQKELR